MPFVIVRTALSQDYRAEAMLRPGASLRLRSIFDGAVNLVDERGDLLTLVGPRGRNGPATVVLAEAPLSTPTSPRPGTGSTARVLADGRLVLDSWLTVRLDSAALWQPPRVPELAHPRQRRANFDVALALAQRASGGLGGLLEHRPGLFQDPAASAPADLEPLLAAAWRGLAGLLPAWRRGDLEAIGQHAMLLVGLGPGLTPSGDDLLAGLSVTSRRLRPGWADWDAVGQAVFRAARGRTTDLGFARLRYAVENEVDERTELALRALLTGCPSTVERYCRDLLGFGHSSGLDTLSGILLAIELAWE